MAVVILNPGASRARRDLTGVRAALAESPLLSGAAVEVTEGWESGCEIAARAAGEGHRLIVAAGGDGTVSSVVNGIMSRPPPRPVLGVLPLGTGNDLSRSLGIPDKLAAGLQSLERKIIRRMDLVRVSTPEGSRYCANVSAGGFSGRVDENMSDRTKESWGPLAYLRTALGQIPDLESYEAHFEFDGGESLGMSVCNVVVANARWAAAGVPVAPKGLLDDGRMDVVLVSSAALPKLGVVAARMAAGRHLDHELVTFFRARRLRIESEPPMWFNVDGELLGRGVADFEVLPGALPVLIGLERPRAI